MALISSFSAANPRRLNLHGKIEASYLADEYDGKKLLQIDTRGSSVREVPGKLSQTIQLDEISARQLFEILREHFGFK
jgi:hypothetical protein